MSDTWKNIVPYVKEKIEPSYSRDVEYLLLKTLLDEVRRKVVESGRSTEWCTMPKLCCVHCTHMSKKIIFIVHHNLSLLMFEMCGVWLFYTQLY